MHGLGLCGEVVNLSPKKGVGFLASTQDRKVCEKLRKLFSAMLSVSALLGIVLVLSIPGPVSGGHLEIESAAEFSRLETDASASQTSDESVPVVTSTAQALKETSLFPVYIAGAVERPGVVLIPDGTWLETAILECGGVKAEADLTKVNLAMTLKAGQMIYVPAQGEIVDNDISEMITPDTKSVEAVDTINLNQASVDQLVSLPGIGPATAEKIIRYREENGKFQSIEEIMNIPGIKDAKFNEIKERIDVN